MEKRRWVRFFGPDGGCLLSISCDGLCEGEIASTIGLLAYEKQLLESEIAFALVEA